MWRYRHFAPRVCAAILALALFFGPTSARADWDPLACAKLAEDLVSQGGKLAYDLIKNPQCSSDLDTVLALAAVLGAAVKADPSLAGLCTNIQALTDSGVMSAIATVVPNVALLQNYINCACPISGIALAVIQAVIDDAQGCANTFNPVAVIGAIGDVLFGGGDNETVNPVPPVDMACTSPQAAGCSQTCSQQGDGTVCSTTCTDAVDPSQYSCAYGSQCGANLPYILNQNRIADQNGDAPINPSDSNYFTLCVACSTVANATTKSDGSCGCMSGFDPTSVAGPSGKMTLTTCTCNAPLTISHPTGPAGQAICGCAEGQGWQGDHCGVCPSKNSTDDKLSADGRTLTQRSCTFKTNPTPDRLSCNGPQEGGCQTKVFNCAAGQKVASWGQCAPACAVGQVHGSSGQCNTCLANFKTVFDNPNTSKGTCQECAANETSLEGSYKCTGLVCEPYGYQDPNKPHSCILCPGNQIYSPGTRGGGPKAKQGGTCGCGESQVLNGNTCVCAKGANMNPATTALLLCSCPAGSKMNYKTGTCVCGIGKHIEAVGGWNSCVANGTIGKPLNPPVMPPNMALPKPTPPGRLPIQQTRLPRKNCAALGPMFINNPNNPSACVRCGIGVNADRTACVRPDPLPVYTGRAQRPNAPWALPGSRPGSGPRLRPIPGRFIVGPRR